ncbi:unnamed protein product [Urochloa humidicola]
MVAFTGGRLAPQRIRGRGKKNADIPQISIRRWRVSTYGIRARGRSDSEFRHWRWRPHLCNLPKFNATEMLERSRNGRIVFSGESIGRNQWESMVCMLAGGASPPTRV